MPLHVYDLRIVFFPQPSENVSMKVIGCVRPLTAEEVDKGGKSVVKVSGGDKITVAAAGKVSMQ
jgi:hypothetical protein